MPWKESTRMDERKVFVKAYLSGLYEMAELCRGAGVSRPTGYVWVERYRLHGEAGLQDRSHAVQHCPHRTPPQLSERLLEVRREHPYWGPRKLLAVAARRWPQERHWPGRSTVAELLRSQGLSRPPRRRPRQPPRGGVCARTPPSPNALWTFDFKGEFRMRDRQYCYPLTTTDLASRKVLQCVALASTAAGPVQRHTDALMRAVGLPQAIHSDGGTPFAGTGLGHLTRLGLHWIKLGIRLERSRPASPGDNASHERMHRTLKQQTTRPPGANLRQQQQRFDRFRTEFNHERPHEALLDRTPDEIYRTSARPFPARLEPVSYPGHFELRRITHGGSLCWQSQRLFLSSVLAHETVGLEEIEDGVWSIFIAHHLLARLDAHVGKIIPVPV